MQRNTSEIYVLQSVATQGESWPSRSQDLEREALVAQELAQFIANTVTEGSISMLAEQALEARGKVFLRRDGEREPYLHLELPFLRAWGSLALALERAGFIIDDTDRSERLYWVTFSPPTDDDEKRGWWRALRGLFARADDEPERYRVQMRESTGRAVEIRIQGVEGETLAQEEAERLLNRIKRFLS